MAKKKQKKKPSGISKYFPKSLRSKILRLRAVRLKVYKKGYHSTRGKPFPLAVRFLKSMRQAKPPEIVVFGDSVCERVAAQDSDRRNLGQMVDDFLDNRRVHVTSYSAYTSYMYSAFLELSGAMGVKAGWVVLPFNLRCVSPQWDACPIWQYTQENAVVQALVQSPSQKPLPVVPTMFDLTTYHATAAATPLSDFATVGQFKDATKNKPDDSEAARERFRNLLFLHYGIPVLKRHRQLSFLCNAANIAVSQGARVLVYLTPINYQFLREIGGDALLDVVRANRAAVLAAIKEAGLEDKIVFHDWADSFEPSMFFHPEELTEHLAEEGRKKLATMISDCLLADEKP